MTIHFVRHAKAGSRNRWDGPDDQRPLTDNGRLQAQGLLEALRDEDIEHIVSSPYVRCRQSVEPLAEVLRLPVELSDALGEGATLTEALRLIEKYGDSDVVLCSHGDVIPAFLEHLLDLGIDLGDDVRCEKGSTWRVSVSDGVFTAATYVPPPA